MFSGSAANTLGLWPTREQSYVVTTETVNTDGSEGQIFKFTIFVPGSKVLRALQGENTNCLN